MWKGFREDFIYDEVNRLKTATGIGQPLQMTYQDGVNDRIAVKSDAGSYIYNSPANHRLDSLHAVAGYTPASHRITYTAEGKVDTIRESDKLLVIKYGTDNERFKAIYTKGDTLRYTRYYFNTYEKEILADGTIKNLNYIYAGGDLVAIHVQKTGADSTFFVYTDYLGSIRCITDSAGNVKQRLGFDAWGNRRDPITGEKVSPPLQGVVRGFTGHEHLDEFGLINMNGRVYDPMLGMFLSPDNFVQAPDFTQNFNRYAYCLNNPLMYTDPSGDFITWIIGGVIGGITNVYQNRDHISNFKDWFVYYNIGNLAGSTSAMLGGLDIWDNPIASGFISGHSAGFITSQLNSLYQGAGPTQSFAAGTQSGMVGGGVGAGIGAISIGFDALMNMPMRDPRSPQVPLSCSHYTFGDYLGLGDVSYNGSDDFLGSGAQESNSGLLLAGGDPSIWQSARKAKVGGAPELFFDGRRLYIVDTESGKVLYSTKAVSGEPLSDGNFDYSKARQKTPNAGPTPSGVYYVKPGEMQTITLKDKILGLFGRGAWPGGTYSWGEQRLWIYPNQVTVDGVVRGNFSIHGGAVPGSEGCIDLTSNITPFLNNLKRYSRGYNTIILRVLY